MPAAEVALLIATIVAAALAAVEAGEPAVAPPRSVAIGALMASSTMIGRAAKSAMLMALREINEDESVLNGTQLVLHIEETNCTALQGAAAAMELMRKKVVAIIGPQTSEVAHFVAHMATATRVPVVSFSATDPTLSEYQFPYFIRMARSDKFPVEAIADMVKMFEWKEVIAFYSDDHFGTNGLGLLHDAVAKVGATVAFKSPVTSTMSDIELSALLANYSNMGGRIFVVHTDSRTGRRIFTRAYNLRMLSTGFVWIVTETLTSVLDSIYRDEDFVQATQGVVGIRSFLPDTPQLQKFKDNWNNKLHNQTRASRHPQVNIYGYYAYDTVWTLAYAIDKFIAGNGSFAVEPISSTVEEQKTDFAKIPVFTEGSVLLHHLMNTSFQGAAGKVEFNRKGELVGSSLEVVNMFGRGLRVVGYWNRQHRLSVNRPDSPVLTSGTSSQKRLHHIVWPGGGIHVPRGWMLPRTGKELHIGVPIKRGYKEFVDVGKDASYFHGYCIDVFKAALSCLPYAVSYSFKPFGNRNATPSYDELVERVANKEYDAAVGDITITQKRAKLVDFTQPYTLSGLVLVVPFTENHAHRPWAFLQPFSTTLWWMTGLFFLFTGIVVWLLEHPKNRDFKGRPSKQIVTCLWFIFSTLFFSHRENVKSTGGRIVVIIWLFFVLILISSYTASFTSILTVRRLKPTIQGLSKLVASDVRIGYQEGSFVKSYLEQLSVDDKRLVALSSLSSYSVALSNEDGGVGAVVEELPYVQLLLSSNCKLAITGEEEFSKSGWGFAFQKGSPLAADISTAILTLAETGELQRIHETWLHTLGCADKYVVVKSDKLDLRTFSGLFGLAALVAFVASLVHIVRSIWQAYRTLLLTASPLQFPSHFTQGARFLRSFSAYVGRTGKMTASE